MTNALPKKHGPWDELTCKVLRFTTAETCILRVRIQQCLLKSEKNLKIQKFVPRMCSFICPKQLFETCWLYAQYRYHLFVKYWWSIHLYLFLRVIHTHHGGQPTKVAGSLENFHFTDKFFIRIQIPKFSRYHFLHQRNVEFFGKIRNANPKPFQQGKKGTTWTESHEYWNPLLDKLLIKIGSLNSAGWNLAASCWDIVSNWIILLQDVTVGTFKSG